MIKLDNLVAQYRCDRVNHGMFRVLFDPIDVHDLVGIMQIYGDADDGVKLDGKNRTLASNKPLQGRGLVPK